MMEGFDITLNSNEFDNKAINETLKKIIDDFTNAKRIADPLTLYTLIVIYSLMMIVAFILNTVIFFTVLISKNLHQPNILLSLNLIIANILITIICTPFTMSSIIFESELWSDNEPICKLIPFIQTVTVFVIRPLNNFSKHKIIVNLVIWILAIIPSIPVLIYQRLLRARINTRSIDGENNVIIKNVFEKELCIEQYPESIRIVYTILTFIYAFIIPLLSLTFFHYKIKIYLNANILKFDLKRDKLMNLTNIKTISNKNLQSLFNVNKRNSDANYHFVSLIDLNLFNSSDSHSSPTQMRDYSAFNSDLERTRLSFIKLNPKKKLNKSLTLSNNFQFNSYLPVYKIKFNRNSLPQTNCSINKSNTINNLPNEIINENRKNCASFLSLNHFSINRRTLESTTNEAFINDSSSSSSNPPNSMPNNSIVNQLNQRKKYQINKRCFKQQNRTSNASNFSIIYRSLSDSNLFDLNQSSVHNSFLHDFNQRQSNEVNNSKNLKRPNNQNDQISPTFSTKNTNLDYLKLVNFDYNQRQNTIIHLQNSTTIRTDKSRRSEQLKLASFTRFSCFLNRMKRFHYLNKELQRNQKITFILIAGIIVFALSWLPLNIYHLYNDINYFYNGSSNWSLSTQKIYFIFSICHMIAMSSAIWNAILYGLLNTNIQKELIKLFKNCSHSKR